MQMVEACPEVCRILFGYCFEFCKQILYGFLSLLIINHYANYISSDYKTL